MYRYTEAFAAGKALLQEAFPEECDPAFGGEVLSGVAGAVQVESS